MDETREFLINFIVYNLDNEYTKDDIELMILEFFESKNLFCTGTVKDYEE